MCLYRSKEKRNPFFFKEKEINFGLKKAIGDTRTRFERTQAELVAANKKYDFYDVFIRNGQSCLSLKKVDTQGEIVSYIGSIEKVEKILFKKILIINMFFYIFYCNRIFNHKFSYHCSI